MNARSDQLMELLRKADTAPAALDHEQTSSDYRRLHAAISSQPPDQPTRAPRRRLPLAVLAAGPCAVVLAIVLLVAIRSRHHVEATQSSSPPLAHFAVSVNGTSYRFNQTVPMVAEQKYKISVRATMPAGAHFTVFELIVAGNHSGTSSSGPFGNFDPVVKVPHPNDSLMATGTWTAWPMGGPTWVEAVYSTIDTDGSISTGQTLVKLQIR